MNVRLASTLPAEQATGLLVIVVSKLAKKGPPAGLVAQLDEALDGHLWRAASQEGFAAKPDQLFILNTHGRVGPERIALVGPGLARRPGAERIRLAVGAAARAARRLRIPEVSVVIPEDDSLGELAERARACVEGFVLGDYRFDRYRTSAKKPPGIKTLTVLAADGADKAKEVREAVDLGRKVAEATNFARDLVNEPAGTLSPAALADAAQKLAKPSGLKVWVGGKKDIDRLKMGMFAAVARGSSTEPRLIRISWEPKSSSRSAKTPRKGGLAFIGKGITFDSGGLSMKSPEGMVEMKTDMGGSAAVIAAMKVVAELKPPFPVHAYVGACENMVSGDSYHPGDIITSRLGKTVEVTNTDAEGRLVLGDVMAWANEQEPEAMVDVATLTGACIVALGRHIVGAFGEQGEWLDEVLSASESAGEWMWPMPISELQRETLRSEIADMTNAGERTGGAISAAMFLREFVGETPWVHLDIAGPSVSNRERGYYTKGATGAGVRTLVEVVRRRMAR